MTYRQTLDYMFSRLPMFQRIGSAAYKADLNNTIAICNLLGNPENKFRSIHVAGTNGKGSTSHIIASILQESGLKVGLYTSPHLKDFRERIKINGKEISKTSVIRFVEKYQKNFEEIQPSFFEMSVGLAFDYFVKKKVDIAVIETGLGGRLDSTNIITPLLSVITNISNDHNALLGDTLEKIALEKAGIIKPNIPVVIGETQEESAPVFIQKAMAQNSPVYFADQELKAFNVKSEFVRNKGCFYLSMDVLKDNSLFLKNIESPLPGFYQTKNIITVLKAMDLLSKKFDISEKHIRNGIKNVIDNTGLMGRWQVLAHLPLTLCDTGHNEAGIQLVLAQIRQTPHKHLHFVIGMVNDKEVNKMLNLFPATATYYFCRADIPRSLDASQLKEQAGIAGLKGDTYSSVKEAYKAARNNADENDMIFIGGSTFVVAEVV